jgi:hypothetical protein
MLSYLQHSIKWRKTFYTFSDSKEAELAFLIDKFTKGKNGNLFSNTSDSEDEKEAEKQEVKQEKKDDVKEEEMKEEKEEEMKDEKQVVKEEKKEDEKQEVKEEKQEVKEDDVKQVENDKTIEDHVKEEQRQADNIKKFEQMITEKEDFPDVRKNPKFRLLYKKLLLKYHPDKTGGDETIFSNIREDVENKHLLFFIKYTRESFIDCYKDDVDTWTFIVKSHIEKWKKIVYAMT